MKFLITQKHKDLFKFCMVQTRLIAYYMLVLTPFRYMMIYKFKIEATHIPAAFLLILTMSDKVGDLYRFTTGEVIELIMTMTMFQCRKEVVNYRGEKFRKIVSSLISMSILITIIAYCLSASIALIVMFFARNYYTTLYILALMMIKNLVVVNSLIRGVNDIIYIIPIKNLMVSTVQISSPLLIYMYFWTPSSINVVLGVSLIVGIGTIIGNYVLLASKVGAVVKCGPVDIQETATTTAAIYPAAIVNNVFKFLAVETVTLTSNLVSKLISMPILYSNSDDILDASLNYSIYRHILGTYDVPITLADKCAAARAKNSEMMFNATFITSTIFTLLIYSIIFYGMSHDLLGKIFFMRAKMNVAEGKLFIYGIPLYAAIKPIEVITIINKRLKFQNLIYTTMIAACIIAFMSLKAAGFSTTIAMAYTNIIKSAVFFILSAVGGYLLDDEGVITIKGIFCRTSILLVAYFGLMKFFGV